MQVPISRFLSQKFRFYTFACITLLLLVHGYNLNETYLQPFTTVKEPLTFTTFFEYFVANGLLRFRIPLLFIISGYIYSAQDRRPYGEQIKKRAATLLVPYLIWSAIGLAITYAWQQFPITARAVLESRLDQVGDNRPYAEIGWAGVLFRWLCAPISFQVWFILALFLYDLMYPFIRWAILRFPIPWFIFTFLVWATEMSFWVIDGRGLFFFSVGIWFQKMSVNLEQKPKWISMYISWLLFIGLSVIKTFMAFELDPESPVTYWLLNILHQVAVISGIVAVWFGADRVVKWGIRKQWFNQISSFSFFIFGLHAPLAIYLTRLFYIYLYDVPNYRLLTYVVVPVIVLYFCIVMAAFLKKLAPGFYRLATGGRGFRNL